jgi:uncharacterized protein YkwD
VHSQPDNRPLLPRPDDRRPRRRRFRTYSIAGVAGLTMLAGQCAPQQCAPAPPAATAPSGLQRVVDLTNQRRAEHGLPALAIDTALMRAAQAHSADQAKMDRMSHVGSDGSHADDRIERQGYSWTAWGENVAMGYPDAASVMDGWMNSRGHRENILSPHFTEIGVGLAYAADGTPYWTQDFGRP